jgi:hypothetical protein
VRQRTVAYDDLAVDEDVTDADRILVRGVVRRVVADRRRVEDGNIRERT